MPVRRGVHGLQRRVGRGGIELLDVHRDAQRLQFGLHDLRGRRLIRLYQALDEVDPLLRGAGTGMLERRRDGRAVLSRYRCRVEANDKDTSHD